ncbi:MAG: hypothetical protein FGM54_01985, partial [Chitinophagaceae bacterium]|nr:hypothetical protein [Chitinophagaceae bacterium]
MKKTLLFSLVLIFVSTWGIAQVGNTNTNNNTGGSDNKSSGGNSGSPYFQNPYNSGGVNLNLNNGNNNTGNPSNNKDNNNSNKNTNNPATNDPDNVNRFRDMNQGGKEKSIDQLKEQYKNDPDYLRYLNTLN